MWVRLKFDVFGMTAKESFYNFGGVSPATFIHFAHALSERFSLGIDLEKGVVPLVSKVDLVGFRKFTMHFSAPKPADKDNSSGRIPIPKMNISCGIIFYARNMTKELMERIEYILPSMRFGGGIIKPAGRAVTDELDGLIRTYRGFFPVEKRLIRVKALPQSRIDMIRTLEKRDPDVLDCLIYDTSLERGRKGWKKPFLAGYRFLNEPVVRADARKITDRDVHVFAEPVLGILEWRSTKNVGETPSVWRLSINEEGIRYSTF